MSPVITLTNNREILQKDSPIVYSYNDQIIPLLGAVDRLRDLGVMQEGVNLPINLPTLVVIGDQSSGKSSVLESLAEISLPRIRTRVPLILMLQQNNQEEISLKYKNTNLLVTENHIAEAITKATEEVAGKGKGVCKTPLTLIVKKKKGIPNLTMIDLPGITPLPVGEQISEIIMDYIKQEDVLILNVLSAASVDFSTCESIQMSQKVDKTGRRTLAVVTKVDKFPEDVLDKVRDNIGLGYICVRNRIGDETLQEARTKEARLFENHQILSKLKKSMAGVPALAERLMYLQSKAIVKCLPDMDSKINEKISSYSNELNKLPRHLTSFVEATTTCVRIIASSKTSLNNILFEGLFNEYPRHMDMMRGGSVRIVEMIDEYNKELEGCLNIIDNGKDFLVDELERLEKPIEATTLHDLYFSLMESHVDRISMIPTNFVEKIWKYLENVIITVLSKFDNYPQLVFLVELAAKRLVARKKKLSVDWVNDIVAMEKSTHFSSDPEFYKWNSQLSGQRNEIIQIINDSSRSNWNVKIEGFGEVDVGHLRGCKRFLAQAFDLKMWVFARWKLVLKRLSDYIPMHVIFCVQKLVTEEFDGILGDLMEPNSENGLQWMLESSSVANERRRLRNGLMVLKWSRDVAADLKRKFGE
ncbi:hypothetical protein RD792_008570 [Penstemon davidsonii]|uniref:Dynamin-related protein 4C-like n=1 Tax=Penstemon davidsonii TaxID=160366 RepID=A0ABR0D9H5_9LAMI|nr:hypothetical protein RD792_008570 [Penstemon davidsonii]